MDYSVYDAYRAGFERVLFIIRPELHEAFEDAIGRKARRFMQVDYAYQTLDRLPEGQDTAFVSQQNVPVAGRIAALFSSFGMDAERKLLGLVALGGSTHAHEYRILFAVPELDEQALADWWEYAVAAERELVKPDKAHEFSLVSVILVTGKTDRAVQKKLKKLAGGRDFSAQGKGWSAVRMAVVELDGRRLHTNRMGDSLKNILKPFL